MKTTIYVLAILSVVVLSQPVLAQWTCQERDFLARPLGQKSNQ